MSLKKFPEFFSIKKLASLSSLIIDFHHNEHVQLTLNPDDRLIRAILIDIQSGGIRQFVCKFLSHATAAHVCHNTCNKSALSRRDGQLLPQMLSINFTSETND